MAAGPGAEQPPEIEDDEILYRRVTTVGVFGGRPTKYAFHPEKGEDVDGLSLQSGKYLTADEVMKGHDNLGLASLTAKQARDVGAKLERDPNDPTHILIRLPLPKKVKKGLADAATILRQPRAPSEGD